MPATNAVRDALARAAADSCAEIIRLQETCSITTMPDSCEEAVRVVDTDWSLTANANEEEVERYVREKSALEASIVAYGLTQDSAAGRGFTLDDPCNILGVCSRLHASWNRDTWALVPTMLDDFVSWLKKVNEEWQVALSTDEYASRNLRLDNPMQYAALTYEFVVLDEDEFSGPEDLLVDTINHDTPQYYVALNGRLCRVADAIPFTELELPRRFWPDSVNPFIFTLSAFHRFRRTLERRGVLPTYLHGLWATLQVAVDLLFFKPPGWIDPTAHLTDAFVRMAMHGKRERKPYRDELAEAHAALMRRRQRPYEPVVCIEPSHAVEKYREIMNDPQSAGTEKNHAMFALLSLET
ncbi:hypothetical protein EXIGLDRAFT_828888 [Exidia glandulosa HHB12029]|uniref:Uncharacterized protein n=1 Tax=Exidia glandulosa HHB12029 TaxID=1314781 RepID=A0A165PW34_EXIGL|nr:hypothetical protein EXIGLDRAFT_828888 [Exidia glandulosa HHB12029]